MDASSPITVDGKTYPKWMISLAISQLLRADGSEPISLVMRCTPAVVTSTVDGPIVETADASSFVLCRGSEAEITDPQELAAFVAVQTAVVTYLRTKGF